MPALNEVPAYRRFIAERDKALEALLNRAISESNDLLRGVLMNTLQAALAQFESIKKDPNPAHALRRFESMIDGMFEGLARQLAQIQSRMMGHAELLAAVGEVEAIGRATATPRMAPFKAKFPTHNERGEPILGRARLSVHKIQRKLLDALQASVWLDEDTEELKRRLGRAMPDSRQVRRPPRVLKPIKEADRPFDDDEDELEDVFKLGDQAIVAAGETLTMTQGFIADNDWRELVSHVLEEYVPTFPYRGKDPLTGEAFVVTDKAGETRYFWDYEQEKSHEFVTQIMNGTNEAAKANGITTLMWQSIMDESTDECCEWRDGLTLDEINEALQNEHSDDECKVLAPPAHFGCRCRMSPVIDKEDLQPPPSNLPEFEEWLTKV